MKRLIFAKDQNLWEALLAQALVLCLAVSFVSISLTQIFLMLAIIFWAVKLITKKENLAFPLFFLPLLIYAGLSLLSAFFSVNPQISLLDSRELLLYIIVPLLYTAFSRTRDLDRTLIALLVSALLSSAYSLYYFFVKAYPGERIKGFMSHYMTQAGLLLLFSCLALSMALFSRTRWRILWAGSLLLSLISLALTMTRGAWVGFGVALCFILFLYKPKALILVPVVAGLLFAAAPQTVKQRALSIFSLNAFSNRQRVEYIKAGIKIIKDYPLLGTGSDTVDMVFQNPKYNLSEDAKRNVHLHNNFIQIAAERGLPTLAAWLAFLVWAFLSLFRMLKNRSPSSYALTAAALAALLALVSSGAFEYNFADSEIAMLFFFILTVPFARVRVQEIEKRGPG